MLAVYTVVVAALAFASNVAAESHRVTFTNNCGKGSPKFLYQGNSSPGGARTIQGELNGGIAWLSGADGCENNGVNCGAVEFTLQNTGYSQADITLEPEGNHLYKYPLGFNFIDGCSDGLHCGSANCAEASHSPPQVPLKDCQANNCGIHITFC
ncbi:hypothetical protein CONPUDRAFT_150482 [Coniophora puteana RWD-64-598 SS2]|uniref:Glycopeptide n=1 Tax=Coniophora puteana (strain RWD-64-598) TaxID=741705 RepID=A0A5M3N2T0_CONPW|nr:uncharacterized protein CONPUDRAFT_150482 [Coniophora puteana RWD-64-598 SS2]EIW85683.1 hypothetical protein CONPUDRAFT_150482 [Coniophora puteana RWD-64-598 SS2]